MWLGEAPAAELSGVGGMASGYAGQAGGLVCGGQAELFGPAGSPKRICMEFRKTGKEPIDTDVRLLARGREKP